MNCPKCDSSHVRRSHHIKWGDLFHSPFGKHAFRCRTCRLRFYAAENTAPAEGPARKLKPRKRPRTSGLKRGLTRMRPWMWEAAIFVFMLLIFFVFLRYLTREPAAGPEGGRATFTSDVIRA